jgi:hypothetical protein
LLRHRFGLLLVSRAFGFSPLRTDTLKEIAAARQQEINLRIGSAAAARLQDERVRDAGQS